MGRFGRRKAGRRPERQGGRESIPITLQNANLTLTLALSRKRAREIKVAFSGVMGICPFYLGRAN